MHYRRKQYGCSILYTAINAFYTIIDAFVYPLPTYYCSDHVVGILFEVGGVRTFFQGRGPHGQILHT